MVFFYIFFIFTLYSAHSRVGREPENLMLRNSVLIKILPFPTLCRLLQALWIDWWNSTPRFASFPKQENENDKYFIFSSRNRSHNLSRLQSHVYALHLDWPHNNLFLKRLWRKSTRRDDATVVGSYPIRRNKLLFLNIFISSLWHRLYAKARLSFDTQHAMHGKIRLKVGNVVS